MELRRALLLLLTPLDVLNFVDLRLSGLDPDFRQDRHQSLPERLQLLL